MYFQLFVDPLVGYCGIFLCGESHSHKMIRWVSMVEGALEPGCPQYKPALFVTIPGWSSFFRHTQIRLISLWQLSWLWPSCFGRGIILKPGLTELQSHLPCGSSLFIPVFLNLQNEEIIYWFPAVFKGCKSEFWLQPTYAIYTDCNPSILKISLWDVTLLFGQT